MLAAPAGEPGGVLCSQHLTAQHHTGIHPYIARQRIGNPSFREPKTQDNDESDTKHQGSTRSHDKEEVNKHIPQMPNEVQVEWYTGTQVAGSWYVRHIHTSLEARTITHYGTPYTLFVVSRTIHFSSTPPPASAHSKCVGLTRTGLF